MKILLIHNFYQYRGGEDTYFLSLTELLKRKRHKVYVYTKDSRDIDNNLLNKLSIAGGLFWNNQVESELSEVISQFQPDVAHFHNIYPLISPTAYQICKKFNIPIVQTIHNYRLMCPKGLLFRNDKVCELCIHKNFSYPSILYNCYHNSKPASLVFSPAFFLHKFIKSFDHIDTFIFPTQFTRDYYMKHLNLDRSKTCILPYFIANISKETHGNNRGKNYFLFAGRLSPEKGILQLLQLFSTLPQLKLLVIGNGPLHKEVLKYSKYKNISIKNFLPRGKIFQYMQNALFTIIPSLWYEVLPMVFLESLANSTPVIASKFGSLKTLIKEGKTGFFFKYNDFGDLRSKLKEIWSNKLIAKPMRIFARREYQNKYTEQKHYESLMAIYQKLLLNK